MYISRNRTDERNIIKKEYHKSIRYIVYKSETILGELYNNTVSLFTNNYCSRFRKQFKIMNNQEISIIHKAVDSLYATTKIKGNWEQRGIPNLDGMLSLMFANEVFTYNIEIKGELRNQTLPQIYQYNEEFKPFMLVASRISPAIKKELRANNVAYLEVNGNFYLKEANKMFWIDANEPLKIEKDNRNRAFTKTGVKVLFEFLNNPTLINQTYRQIAQQTGTSIGNITNIIQGLKQDGFVLSVNSDTLKFNNIEGLIQKWSQAFTENLKPSLRIGSFRFLKENDLLAWKELNFDTSKIVWGGEPAGDLLTNYLKPEEFTLYTDESRTELIRNYRLIPDEKGSVKVYEKFWKGNSSEQKTAPPLIVYADLMGNSDRRSIETAQKIYDEYLQNKL